MNIQSVILAGGSGTRLWPLSRSQHPKQFLPLDENGSLLNATLRRLSGIGEGQNMLSPIVICNSDNRFFVAEHFRQLDIHDGQILLEPCGRNTAPALTLAALQIQQAAEDAIMFVSPSDHIISNLSDFYESVSVALGHAEKGHIVTLGIVPTLPETGFGYIKHESSIGSKMNLDYYLGQFIEKPNIEDAQSYIDQGEYLWNSGMFILRASVWIENIKNLQPDIFRQCQTALERGKKDGNFVWIDSETFKQCPSDSIDYAVMEKLSGRQVEKSPIVVKLEAGWSDVGSWSAYWEANDRDSSGNVLLGDAIAVDTTNSLIISTSRLVSSVGLDNVVAIETKDAVLIADKDKSQDVRKIVDYLELNDRDERNYHREVHRPWGTYDTVDAGDRFVVKRIVVKPGASLSLQMHHHRAEHWIVVKGTAKVTRDSEEFLLSENESIYISIGQKHRLENQGRIPLELIEVQTGSYLNEDDIVRFEDVYNREDKS